MGTDDAEAVAVLSDRVIGLGYYPSATIVETIERSRTDAGACAWVAVAHGSQGATIVAFRFVYPPGRWEHGRGRGLSPERWPAPLAEAAYFQSCFVDQDYMGHGIGRRLAQAAIDRLRDMDARCIVAHSWKESPHGSSRRYLERMGFVAVDEHPKYWSEIDYVCQLDGKPCQCTAIEMVLDLTEQPHNLEGATP
jgi:GNAT superfamily N-acetyltransferase